MEYLKVNGTEYPAHFCGKQIDRDWDGRASKTVTLASVCSGLGSVLSLLLLAKPVREAVLL